MKKHKLVKRVHGVIIVFSACILMASCDDPIKYTDAAGTVLAKDSCISTDGRQSWIVDIDPESIKTPEGRNLNRSEGSVNGVKYMNLVRIYFNFDQTHLKEKKVYFTRIEDLNEECKKSSINCPNYSIKAYGDYSK